MTDVASVGELVTVLVRSWNDRDARLFASLFTENADYVTGQASRIHGREAIADLLGAGETEQVIVDEPPSIRLYGDAAGVVFSWSSENSTRRGVISLVATRHDDGWRIDRLQNTPYRSG